MRSYNYLLFFVAHDLHRSRRFPSHFTCLSDNMFGLIAGSDIQRIPSAGTPLKRAGIRQCNLLRVYVSVIQPVLEYACPVWHTSLPIYLSDHIETIQKRCLRTRLPGYSYDEARSISNLPTLFERRTKLCQSYFRKMQNADHKLHKLLPKQRSIPYGLRTYNTLPVPLAKTDRFRRSLIEWGLANWQHNVL